MPCGLYTIIILYHYFHDRLRNTLVLDLHSLNLTFDISEHADENITTTIQSLQHLVLLVDSRKRCELQALVNFMQKMSSHQYIKISNDLTNKDLVGFCACC